jgi:hypothetical protein
MSGGAGDVVPHRVLSGEIGIHAAESFGAESGLHELANFGHGRPEVAQVNIFAVAVLSERFAGEIDVNAAGQREGDDERRTHEKISLDALMDAGFEVAIAGKNGGGHEVFADDNIFEAWIERAGIADAGGAAIADGLEAELVEIFLQPGVGQIFGDDTRTGASEVLTVGRMLRPISTAFLASNPRRA